jgi:hypothetical protein
MHHHKLLNSFPEDLFYKLQNLIIAHKEELYNYNKSLYYFLIPKKQHHRIPRFYGIPKVHKIAPPNTIPPLRPIVSHSNSLLLPTAKFLDHVLQPLARSYTDYIQNSTALVEKLSTLKFNSEIQLVSLDVVNLFPSILQNECLNIIHKELIKHPELCIFNPNLIVQLLSIHMNNNIFEFSDIVFQQTTRTAMGSPYSPTIANIFMSVHLQKFWQKRTQQPQLFARYIDDIFLIWQKHENITDTIASINQFHPNIKFAHSISEQSIDFLDLTIYKGENFNATQHLSTRTFQKHSNLFQYLHFNSAHPKSVFK